MSRSIRKLHFDSLEQAMQEVQRLAGGEIRTTGHYSYGQILEHLARALEIVLGIGTAFPVPWYGPVVGRLVRRKVINGPPRAGFKLPKKAQSHLWPSQEVAVQAGLDHLNQAYRQFIQVNKLGPHPFFGNLSRDDHHRLQCRHFELHLGFVHPAQ